jgi:hypothetical protein
MNDTSAAASRSTSAALVTTPGRSAGGLNFDAGKLKLSPGRGLCRSPELAGSETVTSGFTPKNLHPY